MSNHSLALDVYFPWQHEPSLALRTSIANRSSRGSEQAQFLLGYHKLGQQPTHPVSAAAAAACD